MSDKRLIHKRAGHGDRVSRLTDFEELVWRYYMTSADDFGVMRFSAVTLQSDVARLENRERAEVQRALERVRDVGLIETFTHQNRDYCFQPDWQDWQEIRHPRQTVNPLPPAECRARCTEATQALFSKHYWHGIERRETAKPPSANTLSDSSKTSEISQKSSGEAPETFQPPARARGVSVSVSVSGSGSVSGSEGQRALPVALDEMFETLRNAYPEARRQDSVLIRQSFIRAFEGLQNGQREDLFARMLGALDQHKASEQWRTTKLIPMFGKWIEEQRWLQVLPASETSSQTASSGRTRVQPGKYSGVGKTTEGAS